MSDLRPPIPDALARSVRQRCGFGCVICACPIYDYDHIEDYAVVRTHEFENLALLCPTCHRKKKKGLLTPTMIRDARETAGQRTRTSFDQLPAVFSHIDLGSNQIHAFGGEFFSIKDFGHVSIRYDSGFLVSASLLDESGRAAIEVVDNRYTLCGETWDIESSGSQLIFRNRPRDVFASIVFSAEEGKISLRGRAPVTSDSFLQIKDDGIFYQDRLLARNNVIQSCQRGLVVTSDQPRLPYALCGTVSQCFVVRGNTAILDSVECTNNTVVECRDGLVWTTQFLEILARESR